MKLDFSSLGLATLFSTLLVGCGSTTSGDCGDDDIERDADLSVDPVELEAYLDANGMLDSEGCIRLCEDHTDAVDVLEWIECRDDGTDADDQRRIYCHWREVATCVGGRDGACVESRSLGVGADPVAAWLAGTMHAEVTSIASFLSLHDELAEHDAPASLCARALRAAREEAGHARRMARLAAARGGSARRPSLRPRARRSLEALALENVVEGCVRETWAALVAAHQAHAAGDPEVRSTMRVIAIEEAAHAQLALDIDVWARTRLDAAASDRVDQARVAAVTELVAGVSEPAAALRERAGLPGAEVARRLLDGLHTTVWARRAAES